MKKKNKSLIQQDSSYCYIHKKFLHMDVPACHLHHTIHGNANRKIADKEGCYCFLCVKCHSALHDKGLYDLKLQQITEEAWLEHNNKTIEEWISLFGKNYL